MLCLLVSALTLLVRPFHGLVRAMFSAVLCFRMVISLFRTATHMALECSLMSLKHKEVVMCFMEKIFVLNKFCSDMSYNAVGQEFNVCN